MTNLDIITKLAEAADPFLQAWENLENSENQPVHAPLQFYVSDKHGHLTIADLKALYDAFSLLAGHLLADSINWNPQEECDSYFKMLQQWPRS